MPDNNNKDQLEILISTDIFDLLNMPDLEEETKNRFLEKMQKILLNDFFTNDVKELITEEEASNLEKNLDNGMSAEDLMIYLNERIPNIEEIMYKKSINFKQTFVQQNVQKRVQALKDKLEMIDNGTFPPDLIPNGDVETEKTRVQEEYALMEMVSEHYAKDEWFEGLTLIKNSRI